MKPLFWFKVIRGVLCAALVTLALLAFFAFLGVRSEDPAKQLALYSNLALFLGCAVGGGISARGAESPLVNSLVCGLICAAFLLIPSLTISVWGADSLLRVALTVLSAIVGGVLFRDRAGKSMKRKSVKRRREIAKKYSV